MDNKIKLTMINTVEEFNDWISKYGHIKDIADMDKQIILDIFEGHGYALGYIENGTLYRKDIDDVSFPEEPQESSIEEVIYNTFEWNREIMEDVEKRVAGNEGTEIELRFEKRKYESALEAERHISGLVDLIESKEHVENYKNKRMNADTYEVIENAGMFNKCINVNSSEIMDKLSESLCNNLLKYSQQNIYIKSGLLYVVNSQCEFEQVDIDGLIDMACDNCFEKVNQVKDELVKSIDGYDRSYIISKIGEYFEVKDDMEVLQNAFKCTKYSKKCEEVVENILFNINREMGRKL